MLRVGLTGGIGSGKSTVARIFEVLGIPVYYADQATRELMNKDETIREKIRTQFGEASYRNGELDRSYIASIVFNDPYQLDLLNAITHPVTIAHANQWMQAQDAPYTIKEAALIFESGSAENLDYVIGVYASRELRIQRVMDRDNVTGDEVLKRMNRQINEEMKMKLCDFVINNDGKELVMPQVISLHEKFSEISKKK